MWFRALGWLKAEKVLKYLFYTCSRIKSQDPTENGLRLRNTYTKETFSKLLKNLLAHKHNLTISALYHCSVYEPILGVKILFLFCFCISYFYFVLIFRRKNLRAISLIYAALIPQFWARLFFRIPTCPGTTAAFSSATSHLTVAWRTLRTFSG